MRPSATCSSHLQGSFQRRRRSFGISSVQRRVRDQRPRLFSSSSIIPTPSTATARRLSICYSATAAADRQHQLQAAHHRQRYQRQQQQFLPQLRLFFGFSNSALQRRPQFIQRCFSNLRILASTTALCAYAAAAFKLYFHLQQQQCTAASASAHNAWVRDVTLALQHQRHRLWPKFASTTSASNYSSHMTTTASIQLQPLGPCEQQRRQRGIMATAQHG